MDEQVIDRRKRRLKTKRPADGDFDSARGQREPEEELCSDMHVICAQMETSDCEGMGPRLWLSEHRCWLVVEPQLATT
jgi:hypothetical protein